MMMFGISRGLAASYIEQVRVQLSHKLCEDASKGVGVGDIVSVRGLGRGKLVESGGQSKKGRTWVKLGMY
jgi:RNA-binding protein YlmH